jgi:hypothetical protein
MENKQQLNIQEIVKELKYKAAVKENAENDIDQLFGSLHFEELGGLSEYGDLAEYARLATIETTFPITSHRPVIGKLIVICKKVVRKSIAWYINPIIGQQIEFNKETVKQYYHLYNEVEHIKKMLETDSDTKEQVDIIDQRG